ncbi:hypothetical protein CRYUN_Cryun25bG0013600 [Craigia yunnanensis]
MYCSARFASRLVSTSTASLSSSVCSRVSSPIVSQSSAYSSSVSFWNQKYRSFSFSSSLLYLRCSAPRWSHASEHPFKGVVTSLPKPGGGEFGKFYSLPALNDPRIDRLPYSIRILLESAIRNCDNFQVTKNDVEKIIDWENTSPKQVEIPFKPARVLLQDFTGVPAVVDLASMRDAMKNLGNDPKKINPLLPVDLVVDHSVQVDVARSENAVQANMELEFQRNRERFAFLKWGSSAFHNMLVVPPGSGIVHQVNMEYLERVRF